MEETRKSLEELGLTKYEASTFVALSRLGEGTATEVHEESTVPRSSVYGALDGLAEMGLVDKSRSRPKHFRAVEPEEALERLMEEKRREAEKAREGLESMRPRRRQNRGTVWSIEGAENILDRAGEIIESSVERVWVLDSPGLVRALGDQLDETGAEKVVVTGADTDKGTHRLARRDDRVKRLEGFVLIGDSEVLVSFETEEGRLGLWSPSSGMLQLFEHFFEATAELGGLESV